MNMNSENNEDGFRFLVEDEVGGVFVVDETWLDKCVIEDEGENDNDEDGDVVFVDHDWEDSNEGEGNEDELQGETKLMNNEDDILNMGELNLFSPHEIKNWEFGNLDVACKFYFEYAKANGFSIRKGRTLRNKKTLEVYQKEFLCSRAGTREDRGLRMEDRVREPRAVTRCNCSAKFVVHVNKLSGLWFCVCFVDEHNHDRLGAVHCSMLPAYRKMGDSDVVQMNNMIKVGIRPPNIFSSFASQSGGYEKIGFSKKDMYNKINEQRRKVCSDAKGAVQFLGELRLIDTMMYFEHTVDAEGRLQHLFWSDGMSQVDYKMYGEVLAFDATYGKNKYFMPLVVFCGVNNHNRSTIFAAAIIANETEETYVWILEQFSKAMKEFTKASEDCMLRYYDIATFQRKWNEIITKFGLEENPWVVGLFEKRTMWATAHLRGKFFGGFRTTSRCEGLHSELSKFVSSRYNLSDFL
ncbi:MULE transposase domain [Sesbania bispinosa]|nr:MULE transposase domain [Sesbania bispinosa]